MSDSSKKQELYKVTSTIAERNDVLASLFSPWWGRKRRKSGTTPYLHIKKAIRRTRLCKRRGRLRVPARDEKNFEIRALINLLSGTADRRRRSGESSDEIFVGLSFLSRGLSQAAREFKVLLRWRARTLASERVPSRRLRLRERLRAKIKIKSISASSQQVFTYTHTGWILTFTDNNEIPSDRMKVPVQRSYRARIQARARFQLALR